MSNQKKIAPAISKEAIAALAFGFGTPNKGARWLIESFALRLSADLRDAVCGLELSANELARIIADSRGMEPSERFPGSLIESVVVGVIGSDRTFRGLADFSNSRNALLALEIVCAGFWARETNGSPTDFANHLIGCAQTGRSVF